MFEKILASFCLHKETIKKLAYFLNEDGSKTYTYQHTCKDCKNQYLDNRRFTIYKTEEVKVD